MLRLSVSRFQSLMFRKEPWTHLFTTELEWWKNDDESLISTISLDLTDDDFSFIILGRDETGLFRGIDLQVSLETIQEARDQLKQRIEELSKDNAQEFPQSDNNKRKHEILVPCVPSERLHEHFNILNSSPSYSPARALIEELSYAFIDLDGNFKKDFQTTGFDARLWELSLYASFYDQKFSIDDQFQVPDFLLSKGSGQIAIEAVTVNPTPEVKAPQPRSSKEEFELCKDYMPIKWGSPLYSKLKKQYWKQEHLKGLPLVFAIHDFHSQGSMIWSLPALSDYLFGLRADDQGIDQIIEEHSYGNKVIPSGFFNQPEAENVSAIVASNEATLTKFNRIAKIAGFGDSTVEMDRVGVYVNLETLTMEKFHTKTKEGDVNENWGSGLWVYHNPNAKIPLDRNFLPHAMHVEIVDGQRYYTSDKKCHILRSVTHLLVPK